VEVLTSLTYLGMSRQESATSLRLLLLSPLAFCNLLLAAKKLAFPSFFHISSLSFSLIFLIFLLQMMRSQCHVNYFVMDEI
jgi:hypothetical protein